MLLYVGETAVVGAVSGTNHEQIIVVDGDRGEVFVTAHLNSSDSAMLVDSRQQPGTAQDGARVQSSALHLAGDDVVVATRARQGLTQ